MPSDPTLYLYTSLTAGSSHIITATSRIETILKANKIPFKAVDCATDDKARMLWGRRSKGRKLPGLVKFNNVIADLEQIEEWNEYGELEDQIEDQMDLFGDALASATSAETQAAETAETPSNTSVSTSQARTASEKRHISISDPKDEKKRPNPAGSLDKKDSPMNMAMRQAGTEAAAKAGQKKLGPSTAESAKTSNAAATTSTSSSMDPRETDTPASTISPKLDTDAEEPSAENTGAKAPGQLAAEGSTRASATIENGSSLSSSTSVSDEDAPPKSNEAQIIDHRRQSSIPATRSSLAETTSIDESHTVASSEDQSASTHRGSDLDTKAQKEQTKATEKNNSIAEEEEDDSEDGEEEEEHSKGIAKKVGATDGGEDKVLKGSKPQEQEAKDATQAGVSVGD